MSVRKALAIVALVPCLALGAEWNITPGHWSWKAGVDNVDALPVSGNLVNDVRVAGCVDAVGECSPTLWIWTSDEEWSQIVGDGDGGTVTSVAVSVPAGFTISGSPITTSGTFTLGLSNQAANRVWAGPATGADSAPTFRALVAADIPDLSGTYLTAVPDPISSDTTGNAATATALAANGANCAAGQAAAGVDASGAAEGCAAYLTDLSGQTIGDLSDVDETGASTGDALVSDGSGAWGPSAAAVCLSNGTNCPASSSAFSAITSGTNTSAAMQVGTGSSLKVAAASSGAIDASGIDADGDGVREVSIASSEVRFDPMESGSPPYLVWQYGFRSNASSGGFCVYASGSPVGCFERGFTIGPASLTLNAGGQISWNSNPGTSSAVSPVYDTRIVRGGVGTVAIQGASAGGAVLRLTSLATAPATCTAHEDLYSDTSGALCWCSATNTWSVVSGAGSCT